MRGLEKEILKKIKFYEGGFGDILPILGDPKLINRILFELGLGIVQIQLERFREGMTINRVVGIETRGAILGGMLAFTLGLPFSVVRNGGKLPKELNPIKRSFVDYSKKVKSLEACEAHFNHGDNVIIIDDWFETGGSARAAVEILEECGAKVVGFMGIVDGTQGYPAAKKFFGKYHYF